MRPRPAEYRAKVIATARAMSPCTIRSILAAVGPDESGTTPSACTVHEWLRPEGIRTISVMQAHKIRLLEIARTMDVPTVSRVIQAAGPNEDGNEPAESAVRGWLMAAGIETTTVKAAYRERIIETARMMEFPTIKGVIHAAGADANGHTSKPEVVSKWLREAGIELTGTVDRWSNETKAEAVRFVVGLGLSPYTARKRFAALHGSSPSPGLIAQWCGIDLGSKPKAPKPAPAPVSDSKESVADSWQAAWDTAEGKTGAAWAYCVLKSWLPDMDSMADDRKEQKNERRRRKRQEMREVIDTAPGRRLAA